MKKAFDWTTEDRLKIYAHEWTIEQARACVGIVHGLGEHCHRYDHVADYLNENGYNVMAYDRRGHGQSEGQRGHTPSYDAYLDEISQLVAQMEIKYPTLPLFLYGHSMGGNLVLKYAIDRNPNIKGIISTAPWIQLSFQPPSFMIMLGKLMNLIYPKFSQANELNVNHLSHQQSVIDAYVNDPLVHNKITASAGINMMSSGNWLNEYAGNMPVPTLMMHGADDQVTSPDASQAFAKRVGNITYKQWEGMYHEIHNEIHSINVLNTISDWIEQHL